VTGALRALALSICFATPAVAQTAQAPSRGTWEVGGGVVYVGGYSLGESAAELTPNTGTQGSFDLFTTSNDVKSAFGIQARIGYFFTPSVAVEGGARLSWPVFESRITGDFEDAVDTTAEETLSQYLFDASLVFHFNNATFSGGQAVPFVAAGAGYLRELHEEDTLVEEGVEYHAAGGIKWWFGSARRRLALRAEAGFSIRDGGFDFDEGARIVPVAGASIVWLF